MFGVVEVLDHLCLTLFHIVWSLIQLLLPGPTLLLLLESKEQLLWFNSQLLTSLSMEVTMPPTLDLFFLLMLSLMMELAMSSQQPLMSFQLQTQNLVLLVLLEMLPLVPHTPVKTLLIKVVLYFQFIPNLPLLHYQSSQPLSTMISKMVTLPLLMELP